MLKCGDRVDYALPKDQWAHHQTPVVLTATVVHVTAKYASIRIDGCAAPRQRIPQRLLTVRKER
jgi:hypothetical protein